MRCCDGRRQIGAEPDVKRERANSQSSGSAGNIYLGTRVKTVLRRSSISWTLVTR
jgi:hypothetical protein